MRQIKRETIIGNFERQYFPWPEFISYFAQEKMSGIDIIRRTAEMLRQGPSLKRFPRKPFALLSARIPCPDNGTVIAFLLYGVRRLHCPCAKY